MKKLVLFVFCSLLATNVWAQNQYVKHIFEVGRSDTYFKGWEQRLYNHIPFTDVGYTHFLNKKIGIRLTYHVNTSIAPADAKQKARYYPLGSDSLYSYYRYITDRSISCADLLATYRLNHKRHSLNSSLGISLRTDNYIENRSEPNLFPTPIYSNHRVQTFGYSLSLSYQYRVFRNFGISAEGVFRSSKNIPNTFTYGIRFSYLIWNKRKEKEKQ